MTITITLVQFGQTQDFVIESISNGIVNLTEQVPNQSIGSTIDFFVEIELETEETQEQETEQQTQEESSDRILRGTAYINYSNVLVIQTFNDYSLTQEVIAGMTLSIQDNEGIPGFGIPSQEVTIESINISNGTINLTQSIIDAEIGSEIQYSIDVDQEIESNSGNREIEEDDPSSKDDDFESVNQQDGLDR